MMRILTVLMFIVSFSATAQDSYPERVRRYVQQYAEYAISDQRSTGVPAAITLGQGILETEAGISVLMTKANNHFGVKCKNGWQGETILHTDDAKNECFKKYKSALESYHDHSAHLLKNPRYDPLFKYSPTDYAKWAHGLKKCGYATNPKYGYQLIKIIEEYRLQEYTYAALDSNYKLTYTDVYVAAPPAEEKKPEMEVVKPAADSITATPPVAVVPSTGFGEIAAMADSARGAIKRNDSIAAVVPALASQNEDGKIIIVNGLKAVVAHKDDALLQYAVKYKMRYPHLLEMNDMPDEPLAFDTYIYLEKKNSTGQKSKHAVKEGETLLMIAQEEGMQLKKLAAYNLLATYEQPVPGTALYLQETAPVKPNVLASGIKVYNEASVAATQEPENNIQAPASASNGTEEVSFGMGFAAPKEETNGGDKAVIAAEEKAPSEPAMVAAQTQQHQDTVTKKATSGEIVKQPFMRDDPPQPQMKKPATEPEYKSGDKHYIVKRGETAFSIAKRNNITVEQLLKWNRMEATDLKAGQTIIVRQ